MDKTKKYMAGARIAILLATLIWGTSFIVLKDALDGIDTFFLLALRFSIAALVLVLVFIKKLKKINKSYIIYGCLAGAFLTFSYVFQTIGLDYTTPGKNAFLTTIYCILVPFIYWIVKKVKPDAFNYIAAIICIIGIGFVSLDGNLSMGFGDVMTLIGGFGFALHMVLLAVATKDRDPFLLTCIQFVSAAVFLWILTALFGEVPSAQVLSGSALFEIIYLAVFASALAMLLQAIGQKYTPASQVAVLMTLESVFGVVFSVIFYHEVLTPKLVVGFILIFIAVLTSETKLSFLRRK